MGARRHLGVCILAIITTLGSSIGFGQDANSKGAVLIFLDDLHIEFRNTPRLRTGLRQAVERVLAAGRDVAIVSDGPSSVAVRPTKERALLLPVANRISGGGLKAEEMADPTPATAADIRQREPAGRARSAAFGLKASCM